MLDERHWKTDIKLDSIESRLKIIEESQRATSLDVVGLKWMLTPPHGIIAAPLTLVGVMVGSSFFGALMALAVVAGLKP